MSTVWLLVALCFVLWTASDTDAQASGSSATGPNFGSSSIEKAPKVQRKSVWWPMWCIVATVIVALLAIVTAAIVCCCIRRRRAQVKATRHRHKKPIKVPQCVPHAVQPTAAPPPAPRPPVLAVTAAMDTTQKSGGTRSAKAKRPANAAIVSPAQQHGHVLVSTSEKERATGTGADMDNVANAQSSSSLIADAKTVAGTDTQQHTADATSVRSTSVTVSERSVDAILVDSY